MQYPSLDKRRWMRSSASRRQTAQASDMHAAVSLQSELAPRSRTVCSSGTGCGWWCCENCGKGQTEAMSLWPSTLRNSKSHREAPDSCVFLNRCGIPSHASHPRSRRAVRRQIRSKCLAGCKTVSPHTVRHSTAHTCSAPAWTSTPFAPGSGMFLSTRPTSTQKSIGDESKAWPSVKLAMQASRHGTGG